MRWALSTFVLVTACMPPRESSPPPEPVQEEQEDPNGIPWAAGERPDTLEDTTRDVTPEPTQDERPPEYFEDDGVQQAAEGPVCTGRATPSLKGAIKERANEAGMCREKFPEAKAGAKGDLEYSIRVQATGEVSAVQLRKDTLKVDEVRLCVEEVLKKSFVTRPSGGCALFIIPVSMESKLEEPVTEEAGEVDPATGPSGG